MIRLSVVENTKFIEMFATVFSYIHVPSRSSVGRHFLNLVSNVRAKLKNILKGQSHLCTTADIWSTKYRSYMDVSVHWINAATLERESEMMGCFPFYGSHTFDKVAETLKSIQREFGTSERKIVTTVTDSGSDLKLSKNLGYAQQK